MVSRKKGLSVIAFVSLVATAAAVSLLGGLEPAQLQAVLAQAGIWAPLIYIAIYVVATLLILPSTALNLLGGALFGFWMGVVWTSIAAILAAIAAFLFTRTVGQSWVKKRLSGRLNALDAEIQQGGFFYIFAIRLLPIIPYGLVNFVAGLTSISFKSYLGGTILGTVPGLLPFVLLGNSGLEAAKTGDLLPLLGALTLMGLLVGTATWYRRKGSPRQKM